MVGELHGNVLTALGESIVSGRYAPGAVSLLLILKIVWLIATEASDFQSVQPWQK